MFQVFFLFSLCFRSTLSCLVCERGAGSRDQWALCSALRTAGTGGTQQEMQCLFWAPGWRREAEHMDKHPREPQEHGGGGSKLPAALWA